MSSPRPDKEVLPLAATADVAALVSAFENCTLPYRHWTHHAHLCVAVTYLRQWPLSTTLTKLRSAINRYNRECGDPDGYNETITVLFLRRILADMETGASLDSLPQEINRLASTYSVEWLYRYYSRTLIWSEQARSAWTEPDNSPLDF